MAKKKVKKEQTTQQVKTQSFKGLFSLFNMFRGKKDGVVTVSPGRVIKKKDSDEVMIRPINMSPEVEKAWDYFESNATILVDGGNDYQKRVDRYKELEYMIYNEGLMWTAANLYTEEAVTEDEQGNILGINAKKKDIEKNFYTWIKDIGLSNNVLRNISWNLNVYADDFIANSISLTEGVTEITPLSPFMIKDRLEFNPVKIMSLSAEQKKSIGSISNRSQGLKDIAELLTNKKYEDYNSMYKTYLLGFVDVSGNALPPWNITHFRRYSNHSEFAPFGRPLFIGSLARYKSYKATEMLIDSARVASFPKEVYEIAKSEDMTGVDIYQEVNKIRQMIQNVNKSSKDPDEMTIGEPIFTIDGLYSYSLEESRMDLDKLGDMENKRKDLILSTGVPEGYLMPGDRGWGNSGQNLLQQSKIFARKVYATQSAILEGITFLYRIHLMITKQFEGENTEFELYMNYPVVEENSDKLRMKNDSLRLGADILKNFGELVGLDRGEALPIDIVKSVLSQYTFLTPDEVEEWCNIYIKSKEEPLEESKLQKIKEKVKEGYLSEEVVKEVYFMSKKNIGLVEGTQKGKHYFCSFNRTNKLNDKTLTILKNDIEKKKLND